MDQRHWTRLDTVCATILLTIAVLAGITWIGTELTGQNVPLPAVSSAAISINTPTVTTLVSAVSGRRVYATAYGMTIATTAATAQTLVFGYGTTCTPGMTVLSGALSGATQSTAVGTNQPTWLQEGNGGAALFSTPASNALCAITTGSQPIGGRLTYQQF